VREIEEEMEKELEKYEDQRRKERKERRVAKEMARREKEEERMIRKRERQRKRRRIMDTLRCPILSTLMKQPVIAADGHTYERRAILIWFSKNDTSPLTGEVLPNKDLAPNWVVKKLIEEFKTRKRWQRTEEQEGELEEGEKGKEGGGEEEGEEEEGGRSLMFEVAHQPPEFGGWREERRERREGEGEREGERGIVRRERVLWTTSCLAFVGLSVTAYMNFWPS